MTYEFLHLSMFLDLPSVALCSKSQSAALSIHRFGSQGFPAVPLSVNVEFGSWWTFRPRKKKFSPPPPPKIPRFATDALPAPPLPGKPPLLGFSIKNRSPPPPGASDSPSPPRAEKKKNPKRPPRFGSHKLNLLLPFSVHKGFIHPIRFVNRVFGWQFRCQLRSHRFKIARNRALRSAPRSS